MGFFNWLLGKRGETPQKNISRTSNSSKASQFKKDNSKKSKTRFTVGNCPQCTEVIKVSAEALRPVINMTCECGWHGHLETNTEFVLADIEKNLKHESPIARSEAITLLVEQGHKNAAYLLEPLLNDTAKSVSEAAINSLQKMQTEEALKVLIGFFEKNKTMQCLNTKSKNFDSTRYNLISSVLFSISKYQNDKATQFFIKLLQDRSTIDDILKAALYVVGNIDNPDLIKPIGSLLNHNKELIRDYAMRALAHFEKYDSSIRQRVIADSLKKTGLKKSI